MLNSKSNFYFIKTNNFHIDYHYLTINISVILLLICSYLLFLQQCSPDEELDDGDYD